MTLPGPSRTIIVEPVEAPERPATEPAPAEPEPEPAPAEPAPEEAPAEPVPAAPEREEEKEPV